MFIITNSPMMGRNICYLRNKHKMSRETLCRNVGIPWVSLSRIEEGATYIIRTEYLMKICELFHVEMDDILKVDLKIHKR